jgi:hypothetical protein
LKPTTTLETGNKALMQGASIKNDSLDLSNCEKYNLSIQANLDGFSILITDSENQSVIFVDYTPLRLSSLQGLLRKSNEILENLNLQEKNFNKVNVITDSALAKLVPHNLINDKHIKQLFTVKSREQRGKTFTSAPVTERYHLAFAYSNELYDFFHSLFNNCEMVHCMTPILAEQVKAANDGESNIRLHFVQNYFFISASSGKELIYLNSFQYKSAEDILFYLASVRKLLAADKSPMLISGNIEPVDPGFFLINKYYQGSRLFAVSDTGLPNEKLKHLPVFKFAPQLLIHLP